MRVAIVLLALALVAAIAVHAESVTDQPCCKSCVEPQEMFWSIDKLNNMCGQCCMDPKNYPIFHIFEANLTKATDNTPCAERKFPYYKVRAKHRLRTSVCSCWWRRAAPLHLLQAHLWWWLYWRLPVFSYIVLWRAV